LAVTAIRDVSIIDVEDGILSYLRRNGVSSKIVEPGYTEDDSHDCQIFENQKDWTIILWPEFFNIHDQPLARRLAGERGWFVSTISVYDGDYWMHLCCKGAQELHRFCSWPTYWAGEDEATVAEALNFDIEPSRLAVEVGVESSMIQPYLVDVEPLMRAEPVKAHEDDEFPLQNMWVFTDFWRRMGVIYPDLSKIRPVRTLRLAPGFSSRLPTE